MISSPGLVRSGPKVGASPQDVAHIAFSPNGSVLATITSDGVLSFFTQDKLLKAATFTPPVNALVFLSPSVIAIALSGAIEIYHVADLKKPAARYETSTDAKQLSVVPGTSILFVGPQGRFLPVALPKESFVTSTAQALQSPPTFSIEIGETAQVDLEHENLQSVIDGDSVFYLHPEGFEKATLDMSFTTGYEYVEEEVASTVNPDAQKADSPIQSSSRAVPEQGRDTSPSQSQAPQANGMSQPAGVISPRAFPRHFVPAQAAPAWHPHPPSFHQAPMPSQHYPPQPPHYQQAPHQQAHFDASTLVTQMQRLFIEQAKLFETMLDNQRRAEQLRFEQMVQSLEGRLSSQMNAQFEEVKRAVEGAAAKQLAVMQEMLVAAEQARTRATVVNGATSQVGQSVAPPAEVVSVTEAVLEIESEAQQEQEEEQDDEQSAEEQDLLDDVPSQDDREVHNLTPTEDYEDLFLRTLHGSGDVIGDLVDAAPPTRLQRVFPPGQPPLISSTTVLALGMRLARAPGPAREEWLLACARAFEYSTEKTRVFLPRIATEMLHSLNTKRNSAHLTQQQYDSISAAIDEIDAMGYTN